MSLEAIVIKAARKKWRFNSSKGLITHEDLWDLNLQALDKIAIGINNRIQEAGGQVSFISNVSPALSDERDQLELVKHVIQVKMAEAAAAKDRAAKQSQLTFLQELRRNKEIQQLQSMPLEEIEKQIAALEAASAG